MRTLLYNAVPFVKEEVTLALECGVDGLIVPAEAVESASSLARCRVLAANSVTSITLASKDDEAVAAAALTSGRPVLLTEGWEIIPVENLLAHEQLAGTRGSLMLEVNSADAARLAAGILEQGVETMVVSSAGLSSLNAIVTAVKEGSERLALTEAVITEITPVGMGHRVCVDTLSVFKRGQGMLVGNSAAFTVLVNAETEHNEYVASRPFRVNAGAVHAYAMMPEDTTRYLEELRAGSEVLIVDHEGATQRAVVGRVKVERRPMLLLRARAGEGADAAEGAVFLQNAETIRLVQPGGGATSIVTLRVGDKILCRLDKAGRHFGMRIAEAIEEV